MNKKHLWIPINRQFSFDVFNNYSIISSISPIISCVSRPSKHLIFPSVYITIGLTFLTNIWSYKNLSPLKWCFHIILTILTTKANSTIYSVMVLIGGYYIKNELVFKTGKVTLKMCRTNEKDRDNLRYNAKNVTKLPAN